MDKIWLNGLDGIEVHEGGYEVLELVPIEGSNDERPVKIQDTKSTRPKQPKEQQPPTASKSASINISQKKIHLALVASKMSGAYRSKLPVKMLRTVVSLEKIKMIYKRQKLSDDMLQSTHLAEKVCRYALGQ